MKTNHSRSVRHLVGVTGILCLLWTITAWVTGAHSPWLGIGLFCFVLLVAPTLNFLMKLYGGYCAWALERKLRRMSPKERENEFAKMISETQSMLKEMDEESLAVHDQPQLPWYCKALDALVGIAFAFGPPMALDVMRQKPFSWDNQWTGYHVLAMACGVGAYSVGRAYAIRLWLRHWPKTCARK